MWQNHRESNRNQSVANTPQFNRPVCLFLSWLPDKSHTLAHRLVHVSLLVIIEEGRNNNNLFFFWKCLAEPQHVQRMSQTRFGKESLRIQSSRYSGRCNKSLLVLFARPQSYTCKSIGICHLEICQGLCIEGYCVHNRDGGCTVRRLARCIHGATISHTIWIWLIFIMVSF